MLPELDKTDFKILYELDKSIRTPHSKIAKEVHLSKQAVKKRIDKLINKKIITKFITIIDSSNFGIVPTQTFVSLNPASRDQIDEFVNYLTNNKDIAQVTTCEGVYDLYFGIAGPNLHEIDIKLSEIFTKFPHLINHKITLPMIDTRLFPRDYLIDAPRQIMTKNRGFHSRSKENYKIKEIDKKILFELSNDPMTTVVEIAKKISFPLQTVIHRKKYLEENGIIRGYMYLLNERMFIQYELLLEINHLTPDLELKLLQYFASNPNVLFIVKYFGEYTFSVIIETKDLQDYRRFSEDFKNNFSKNIKRFIPLMVHEIKKINFFFQELE